MNVIKLRVLAICLVLVSPAGSANTTIDTLLQGYKEAGASSFDGQAGAQMWQQQFVKGRSCASCHGSDIAQTGKHVKTKKLIKPMALSVNSQRYQSAKKINKWFKRNCKWTLGRECTAQEKGDFLTWLISQ